MCNYGPRTSKWAWPGLGFVLFSTIAIWKMASATPPLSTSAQLFMILMIGVAGLLAAVALVQFWKDISSHRADLFESHQRALSLTPLVMLSENMKHMSSEAVTVLNRFGVRTSWQVRLNLKSGERDWVLADTNVHFGFIEFVLSRSGKALYPKNRFNENSKRWDPDGLVTDRAQHEELERWLVSRLIVSRSHGDFKPAEFIPPWTPQLILETMGLTGEQELYRPDEELKTKDLNRKSPIAGQSAPVRNRTESRSEDAIPLTDEELQAINAETLRNASQYRQ